MKKHLFTIILYFILIIQGCATSSTALKPVAVQNQQNLKALNNNVQVLLALYESLLQAANRSLIYQHIGKTKQEMIAIVGSPLLQTSIEGQTWETLFTKAAKTPIAKQEKYLERYRFVQSALQRGIESADLESLKQREGWIYQTVADTHFTPQQARELLKNLLGSEKETDYFVKAEKELTRYDPKLQSYRNSIDGAQQLFSALKQEITTQLNFAQIHGQAISSFTQVESNMTESVKAAIANPEQLETVLRRLSQEYLSNRSLQDAAIDLLTQKLSHSIGKF